MLGFGSIARRIFGSENDRRLKAYWARVEAINALEPEISALDDAALRAKTPALRERVAKGETLDSLLPEAFAVVREAAKRAIGLRHFDVQLVGGMVLHDGRIAEMKTGEGKTLVATLPVYLNALEGRGVHVVTVNDYLARRDADWMGKVYAFLGLTTGVIVPGLDDAARKASYACDVTYATNNELGFDYLRDNMKYQLAAMAQREHRFAIVDEVDSILIDEARTPLIISGPTQDQTGLYVSVDKVIPSLTAEHYDIDEKQRTVILTEDGTEFVEQQLKAHGLLPEDASLYDPGHVSLVHHTNQALRAHKLFTKDKDYIVKGDDVVIIDEFTGRMMAGRRYSDGLHQALEAKEGAKIQPENVTLASITFQNYFRLYAKLAGMTGTAMTEASEFGEIYGLQVLEIPTNQNVVREDEDDAVFRTVAEKTTAIVEAIQDGHARGQPILVGTTSIEKSEKLSELLKTAGVPHQVLNARYHEQEAYIVAQAGRPGAVTIATNMAGRGTDIQLGGNVEMRVAEKIARETGAATPAGATPEALPEPRLAEIRREVEAEVAEAKKAAIDAGGLWVIGTERHESRRIDNQLRGRSGRQGDPGRSSFFLSLQDDLMRIFGSEKMDGMLRRLGLQDGEAIIHPWVNKAIERSQAKVEARNFEIRKNLLKYDDVMNDQRRAIFEQRREIMEAETVKEMARDMRHEVIDSLVAECMPERAYAEQWNTDRLESEIRRLFAAEIPVKEWAAEEGVDDEAMRERLIAETDRLAAKKAVDLGEPLMRDIEKAVVLQTIDHHWREHLLTLDHLRAVIGLRGYGQRDPLNEYKTEAFQLFESLLNRLRFDVTGQLMNVRMQPQPQPQPAPAAAPPRPLAQPISFDELRATNLRIVFDGDDDESEGEGEDDESAEPATVGAGAQPSRPNRGKGGKGKRRR